MFTVRISGSCICRQIKIAKLFFLQNRLSGPPSKPSGPYQTLLPPQKSELVIDARDTCARYETIHVASKRILIQNEPIDDEK